MRASSERYTHRATGSFCRWFLYTGLEDEAGPRRVSEGLDEARGKQAGAPGALLRALVPAVVALLVHVDYVADPQLELELAVRGIGHDAAESVDALPASRSYTRRFGFCN